MLWARLCAAYPRQETTTATAEVFYEQLCQYTEAQISDAISGMVASSKWFPAVAEIVAEIKGEHKCPHSFQLAEIRLEKARLKSREAMVLESELYASSRLKKLAEEVAALKNSSIALYEAQREQIEQSGLPQAQKKLDAIKAQIIEQQRTLNLLKQKVRLVDQARILQAEQ